MLTCRKLGSTTRYIPSLHITVISKATGTHMRLRTVVGWSKHAVVVQVVAQVSFDIAAIFAKPRTLWQFIKEAYNYTNTLRSENEQGATMLHVGGAVVDKAHANVLGISKHDHGIQC